jgi:hypothetical protein
MLSGRGGLNRRRAWIISTVMPYGGGVTRASSGTTRQCHSDGPGLKGWLPHTFLATDQAIFASSARLVINHPAS